MNPLFWRLFPELSRFPAKEDARTSFKRATWQLRRNPRWWLANVTLAIVLSILILELTLQPLSAYIHPNTTLGLMPLIGVCLGPLLSIVVIWLMRRTVQRALRCELVARGIPCCIRCGYDLTGNTSGICPEYGERK